MLYLPHPSSSQGRQLQIMRPPKEAVQILVEYELFKTPMVPIQKDYTIIGNGGHLFFPRNSILEASSLSIFRNEINTSHVYYVRGNEITYRFVSRFD